MKRRDACEGGHGLRGGYPKYVGRFFYFAGICNFIQRNSGRYGTNEIVPLQDKAEQTGEGELFELFFKMLSCLLTAA